MDYETLALATCRRCKGGCQPSPHSRPPTGTPAIIVFAELFIDEEKFKTTNRQIIQQSEVVDVDCPGLIFG